MATCEKCWKDSASPYNWGDHESHTEAYNALVYGRIDHPCTPEEQCGDVHLIIYDKCRCGLKQTL
jgi:hypothetical protein